MSVAASSEDIGTFEKFPKKVEDDLKSSGVTKEQMRIRLLTQTERHATGSPMSVDGYVIPYFDIQGKPLPFYRVKLFDWDPKYRQLKEEPNHLYFPRGFIQLAATAPYIILTEGEKKAQCAVNEGYACCAVGGVDSWRNKTISMPKDVTLSHTKDGRVLAKLPAGQDLDVGTTDTIAVGMQDLITLLVKRNIPVIIIYDSDKNGEVSSAVQTAAATLGFEFRYRGLQATQIRQLILQPPKGWKHDRITLDDLLTQSGGSKSLQEAIAVNLQQHSAFPVHPNPKEFVNKRLKRTRLSREQMQGLSTAVISDLDASGMRLVSPDEDELYYFHRPDHKLMRVSFKLQDNFSKSPFGVHLYQKYNLSLADNRVLQWIATQFAGEKPISPVKPERVMTIRKDTMYYQASHGQMIRVNKDGYSALDNGSEDILFHSTAVEPTNVGKILEKAQSLRKHGTLPNYWLDVLNETRIKDDPEGHNRTLLALLYSISPWFYRWRGTQLPAEMTIGEPGSGKSTLYQLRLSIMSGRPKLRNTPKDIRDWSASVGDTGGLHVTDNVHMTDSSFKQELSDELCRVITEPDPYIERRKLYSDADLIQVPVKAVFAITAVKQPFTNNDIIQRSIITLLDKGDEAVEYEADWWNRQLERFGGREGWLGHQMEFVRRLFTLIDQKWDGRYRAKFRLINMEQLLMLAAEIYGIDGHWIPEYLEQSRNEKIADTDWTIKGLKSFSEEVVARTNGSYNVLYTAKDIAEWMQDNEDYSKSHLLTNSRSLGKYMQTNTNLLATVAGITQRGTKANAAAYYCHPPKK